MKMFLSDLHLSDGKERDDFQFHREFDDLVRKLSGEFKKIEMILLLAEFGGNGEWLENRIAMQYVQGKALSWHPRS